MANPKISDNAIRDLIITTIGPGNGVRWEKFEVPFKIGNLLPRIKQILEKLQKSGHVYLEGRRYRLTKEGLERYEVLNSGTA